MASNRSEIVNRQSDQLRTENGFLYHDLNHNGKLDVYEDPRQPIEARVADLLQQMILEEKVGQLIMWNGQEDLSFINTRYPGSILHIWGEKLDRAMDLAAQNRLGIPLLVGEDAIHPQLSWHAEMSNGNAYYSEIGTLPVRTLALAATAAQLLRKALRFNIWLNQLLRAHLNLLLQEPGSEVLDSIRDVLELSLFANDLITDLNSRKRPAD